VTAERFGLDQIFGICNIIMSTSVRIFSVIRREGCVYNFLCLFKLPFSSSFFLTVLCFLFWVTEFLQYFLFKFRLRFFQIHISDDQSFFFQFEEHFFFHGSFIFFTQFFISGFIFFMDCFKFF